MRRSIKTFVGILTLALTCAIGSRMESKAANPLLPLDEYIPDVEARVFTNAQGEERLYLYGSHDEYDSGTWCSHQYRVWSASLIDLNSWTDHGVSFSSKKGEGYIWDGKDADGISWSDSQLYAPDVNKIGDTYYLVTCNAGGPALGMATSKNPEGPFSPAKKILYDDGTETRSIDPTLLVDGEGEDMKVYLYWGQTNWFGGEGLVGVELMKDEEGLYTIAKKDTKKILFDQPDFGFYEGPSIRKIHDKYYMLYPSSKGKGQHTMSYAVADEPLGEYKYMGNILENDGCDLVEGNNHGSFCEIDGQWYLFYHRGFGNSNMRRKVCVEKIYFDEEGKISDGKGNLVQMTNHGFEDSLNPYKKIEAAYATHVRLDGYKAGCYLEEKGKDLHPLTHITNGNVVEYRDFDFGNWKKSLYFMAEVLPLGGGSIDIILDDPKNEPIGTVSINVTADNQYVDVYAPVSDVKGIHTVYLKFNSNHTKNICEMASFRFVPMDQDIKEDFSGNLNHWKNVKNATIKNGVLYLSDNTQMETITGEELENYTVQADVKLKKGETGLVFRKQDEKNFYVLLISEDKMEVKKTTNGREYTVGKIEETTAVGETNTYKIECSGGSITVYKNGERKDTFRDHTFPKGKIGFYQSKGTSAEFDNVRVIKIVSRIDEIKINGKSLEGFSNGTTEYVVKMRAGEKVPVVKAYSTDEAVKVRIEQATEIPGTAIVSFDGIEYKIHFQNMIPVTMKSDLFDGKTYGAFWEIQNPNMANVCYEKGKGLTIKTEPTDLGTENPPKNVFLQEAIGDWTIETALTSNPVFGNIGNNWPSAGIVVYGEKTDFIKLVYLSGGVEFNDSNGNKQQIPVSVTDEEQLLYLKLEKKGNEFFASYSVGNPDEYTPFAASRTLGSPKKAGLVTTGFNGATLPEITFKYFKVTENDTAEEFPDIVKPSNLEIEGMQADIPIGGIGSFAAKMFPEDTTYKEVEWFAEDESVAQIVNNPLSDIVFIKGLKPGNTKLSVVSKENSDIYAECTVTVRKPKFLEVVQPNALKNIKNGTLLQDMPFPSTVTLLTESGETEGTVSWDLENVKVYDPSSMKEQTFEVNGIVTLPDSIEGSNGATTAETKIVVTVLAKAEDGTGNQGGNDQQEGNQGGDAQQGGNQNQNDGDKSNAPKTADMSPIGMCGLFAMISMLTIVFKRKNK